MSETENSLGYLDLGLDDDVVAWDGTTSYVNPGEYIVEVTKVEGGQSNAGNRKMVLTYEIKEALGDRKEENEDQVGRTIVQSQSLDTSKDAVAGRLKSLITALVGKMDKRGGIEADKLIGAQMACEIVSDTYTKMDPVTQEKIEKSTIKVVRERHIDTLEDDDGGKDDKDDDKDEAPKRGSRGRGRRTNTSRSAEA